MVIITRESESGFGSEGSGPNEAEIHEWIEVVVSSAVREIIMKYSNQVLVA